VGLCRAKKRINELDLGAQVRDLRAHALCGRLANQERQSAIRVAGLQGALDSSRVQVRLLEYVTDWLDSKNDNLRHSNAVARGEQHPCRPGHPSRRRPPSSRGEVSPRARCRGIPTAS
ncbi:unnamed protein product, partial [Sphacelaria rigidula]